MIVYSQNQTNSLSDRAGCTSVGFCRAAKHADRHLAAVCFMCVAMLLVHLCAANAGVRSGLPTAEKSSHVSQDIASLVSSAHDMSTQAYNDTRISTPEDMRWSAGVALSSKVPSSWH